MPPAAADPPLVVFDPFHDAPGAQLGAGRVTSVPTIGGGLAQVVSDDARTDYHAPTGMQGRLVGRGGLAGVIVPPATSGGSTFGSTPQQVGNIPIVVDPHINGGTQQFRLEDVTQDIQTEAYRMASAEVEVTSPETQRLWIAAFYAAASRLAEQRRAAGQNWARNPLTQAPQTARPPAVPAAPQPQAAPPSLQGALASFAGAGEQPGFRRISLGEPGVAPDAVQPPEKQVLFEIEGFGQTEAYYHDVIIQPGHIVLVYDTHFKGGSRFRPSSAENAPPMAMMVVGDPRVFKVATLGLVFTYLDREFLAMMIQEQGNLG